MDENLPEHVRWHVRLFLHQSVSLAQAEGTVGHCSCRRLPLGKPGTPGMAGCATKGEFLAQHGGIERVTKRLDARSAEYCCVCVFVIAVYPSTVREVCTICTEYAVAFKSECLEIVTVTDDIHKQSRR